MRAPFRGVGAPAAPRAPVPDDEEVRSGLTSPPRPPPSCWPVHRSRQHIQAIPTCASEVTAITPRTGGVTVEVLNYDDRLELHDTSGKPVEIEGYKGEPYARVLADGTVQVNTNSEAYYLNDDRYVPSAVAACSASAAIAASAPAGGGAHSRPARSGLLGCPK
jgi:hypothetical protein